MKDAPCKTCGEPVDMPVGKLCRKCDNVRKKALPSYKKYRQEKTWKNTPSYKKNLQEKDWKNQPWYKKNLQEKAWKNTPSYQKRLQEKTWKNMPSYQKRNQEKAWTTYPKTCEACGAAYEAHNKISRLCPVCYAHQQELKTASTTHGRYKQLQIDGRQILEHRYLAGQLFGRRLPSDEHVHHIDEDPKHNELNNLIMLSNSNHVRLHHYLDTRHVIEEKQGNPKPWSELVVPLSLQWLRVNKVPHLFLSEMKAFKDWLIQTPEISSQSGYLDYLVDGYCRLYLYPDLYRVTEWIAGDPPLAEVV